MSVSDALVTIVALIGPLGLGFLCGYWLGRSWVGILGAVSLGVVLTFAGLAIWYLDAPTSPTECFECSEYWGRWMDETMFTVWLPLTLVLWGLGVVFGRLRIRPVLRGEPKT